MKTIPLKSHLFSGLCLAVLLSTSWAMGQEGLGEQPLKCSIRIESEKIVRGQPIPVEMTIENVSGSEVNLDAVYSFHLLKLAKDSIARNFQALGDSYWSPLNISTGEPLKLQIEDPDMLKKGIVVGSVPRDKFSLGIGEVRTYKIELSKLRWNASILSGWPEEELFDVVPKGRYWLELTVRSKEIGKEVKSNRVEVTVD